MTGARYEFRVSGRMSERARHAFQDMQFHAVPPQTIMVGEVAGESDLHELLARCSAMGLHVVALQRLPADPPAGARRSPAVDEAAACAGGDSGAPARPGTTRADRRS
ncbi:MAG TPA: hypothetical protein VIY28_19630 [Pseudonocardiaceae bacterium]